MRGTEVLLFLALREPRQPGRPSRNTREATKARAVTRWFLRNCAVPSSAAETAEFVTSELVANAVKAMLAETVNGPFLEVSWRVFASNLLVEVTDSSPLPPVQKKLDANSEEGRGLAAVDGFATDWGFFWHRDRKVVFAVLDAPTSRPGGSGSLMA